MMAEVPPAVLWGTLAVGLFGLLVAPWASWWDRRSRWFISSMCSTLWARGSGGVRAFACSVSARDAIWSVQSGTCTGTGGATQGP